ncbi:chaperonin 10-like protein [Phascolomyces articulosus]|uniref:Chaperonin 10-like protein n=1 Tax=Phascolomyces articulosus TaxID=60185 RepID=A0AAD5K0X9_9FUNG|nr:chaperonin 10-like protein [Phascolomyces articulosus]
MTSIPESMYALETIKLGSAEEALKYHQVKTPKVTKPTDILIQVKAIGVNPVEAKARQGNIPIPFFSTPRILGGDYAGVIVDKGSQVTGFNIGDAVFGSLAHPVGPNGSYAEYVLTAQGSGGIAKKPDNVSFEEAACAGIAVVTAYHAITGLGNLPKQGPKKILVIGSSGGVGTYAIQYAKSLADTEVVGICSGKNAELVLGLGADRVVDYTSKQSMDALTSDEEGTYDLIVDAIGGDDYYNQLVNLLKKRGTYSTAVGPTIHNGAEKVGLFAAAKMAGILITRKLFGCRYYQVVVSLPWDKLATDVAPLIANGKIKTVLKDDQIFDLKDGVLAHKKIESHRTVGKIVMRV